MHVTDVCVCVTNRWILFLQKMMCSHILTPCLSQVSNDSSLIHMYNSHHYHSLEVR